MEYDTWRTFKRQEKPSGIHQRDDGWAVLKQFPCHYIIAIEMHILVAYPPTFHTVREGESNGNEKLLGAGG